VVQHSHDSDEVWGMDLNSHFLANGCERGMIEVRDAANGRLRYMLRGHSGPVGTLLVDDDYIVSASEDANILIWEFDSLREQLGDDELPEAVVPVLARDAPESPGLSSPPPSPVRVPFMPDNLRELAAAHVNECCVRMVQAFLARLGFSSQCPPDLQALEHAAQALADATGSEGQRASYLREIALRHWGPHASAEDRLPLGGDDLQ
jgi:hypothetical protein